MAIQDSDYFLVNRGNIDYKIKLSDVKEYFNPGPPLPPWKKHNGTVLHIKNVTGGELRFKTKQCYALDGTDLGPLGSVDVGGEIIILDDAAVTDLFYNRFNGSVDYEFGDQTDVSRTTSFQATFLENFAFKGKGLANWDVSNCEDMSFMFFMCGSFEEDLSGWCVPKIPNEPNMIFESSGITADKMPVWGTCPP